MEKPPDDCVEFLRGINNDNNWDGEGFDLSIFYDNFNEITGRDELTGDWKGTSINWDLVGGEALNQLMSQDRYAFGVARFPRFILDKLSQRYEPNFDYEIFPEEGNDYHGHILMNYDNLKRPRRQTIAALIADSLSFMHRKNGDAGD